MNRVIPCVICLSLFLFYSSLFPTPADDLKARIAQAACQSESALKPRLEENASFLPHDETERYNWLNAVGDSLLDHRQVKGAVTLFLHLEKSNSPLPWSDQVKVAALTQNDASLRQLQHNLQALPADSLATLENALNVLGYRIFAINRFDEAIVVFRLNHTLYPDNLNHFDTLGWALANAGKKNEARKIFQEALKKNPHFNSALRGMTWIRGQSPQWPKDIRAQKVIDRYVKALGGARALAAVTTKKMIGRMENVRGRKETDVRYFKRPELSRAEWWYETTICDGRNIWYLDGEHWRKLPAGQRPGIYYHGLFDGGLFNAQEKGIQFRYAGESTIKGKSVERLKMKMRNGMIIDLLFDEESGLHVGSQWQRCNGDTLNMEISDYRKVGDLLIAHKFKNTFPSGFWFYRQYDTIKLNPPLEESLFVPE